MNLMRNFKTVWKILCWRLLKKLHKNKKKIDFGNVIKNAIKVDISEVQTRNALDQLISRRMLRSVITRGKESFRIMNSNGSFVNPDKCTGECYVQLSNICEQIKALDVKMGQCLSVSNVVEELGKENKFLRNEIENLTGLLDSFTGVIERQAQSGMTGEQFSVQSEKINFGSIRSENAVNLSLNSNNSDNNDEEVIIDSTSDNTSSIIVSKKSLQNKIKNQLNLVRREYKEKFYNQETSLNKDYLLNTKRKTNKYDRCNITTENINQTRNVLIAGDSLLYGVDEQRLSNKYNVKVRCFPGTTISDMFDYLKPLFKNNPESVIIHIGTNDSRKSSSRELLDKMLELKSFISSNLPTSKVIISSPVLRTDNGKAMLTLKNLNKLMKELKINIIDNDNIKEQHLGRKGLHLNGKGTSRLAMNFIEMLKTTFSTQ